jgi:hypothetical protein
MQKSSPSQESISSCRLILERLPNLRTTFVSKVGWRCITPFLAYIITSDNLGNRLDEHVPDIEKYVWRRCRLWCRRLIRETSLEFGRAYLLIQNRVRIQSCSNCLSGIYL